MPAPENAPQGGWGRALDLGMQFSFAVVIGLVLGYYLDRWFETEPVFLLIFMGFGFAAGILSLVRFVRDQNAASRDENPD